MIGQKQRMLLVEYKVHDWSKIILDKAKYNFKNSYENARFHKTICIANCLDIYNDIIRLYILK